MSSAAEFSTDCAELPSQAEKMYMAGQWQLVWRRFRHHKLAVLGAVMLLIAYTLAIFAPFVSPYDKLERSPLSYVPPQKVHLLWEHPMVA